MPPRKKPARTTAPPRARHERALAAVRKASSLREGEVMVLVLDRDSLVGVSVVREPVALSEDPALSVSEEAVLARGGFDPAPHPGVPGDPVSRARAEHATLLADALSAREAARLLDVNESRVRQRLGARTLYGVKDGGGWRLPRFQFVGRRTVPSLEVILPEVPAELHPVALRRWLTSPCPDLTLGEGDAPVSPLDWLASGGDPAPVVELARAL